MPENISLTNINFSLAIWLVVIGVLVVAVVILLMTLRRMESRWQKLTDPIYDQVIAKARTEAERLKVEARAEAEAARLEAVQLANQYLTKAKADIDKESDQLTARLADLTKELTDTVAAARQNTQAGLEKLSAGLTAELSTVADTAAEQLKPAIDRFGQTLEDKFDRTLSTLTELEKTGQAKLAGQVEQAFKQATAEVEQYKQQRLKIVDEQIVALVEETAQITLGRALSGQDHTEIIKAALAEAKSNNWTA